MKKLKKIDKQEQKTREKIAAMQENLKQISEQRIEQENLQIIEAIRALKLSREELYAFLDDGGLPVRLAGELTDGPAEPETIYSRKCSEPGRVGCDSAEPTSDFESEDIDDEE